MTTLMQWYWYDYNNPKNVWWNYKININLETYKTKWDILEKLDINFSDFWFPNEEEKELIEQANAENIEFYHKILWKIIFYKDTIWIILNWEEIKFDKKQIWGFKTSYEYNEEKAISNNKKLLNNNDFTQLLKIFENNVETLKLILNLNLSNYIWWENWVIFNLSNNWNSWHIQKNIKSNKRMFRLGTIYKNKKTIIKNRIISHITKHLN